ncbi:hypothetical protein Syun_014593 [Stephania yunnanensis]|uniref:Uncharacterized protein n=1 Tax=Stephania yunnanensis TaxID=152371 RepID=A0AAP0P8Q0_9MAGN
MTSSLAQPTSSTVSMAKSPFRSRPSLLLSDGFLFVGGAMVALLLVWALWSFLTPLPPALSVAPTRSTITDSRNCKHSTSPINGFELQRDPPDPTFYDDLTLTYSIDKPIKNWDEKRREWLRLHPSFAKGAASRVLMLTGSQPNPCKNPVGDHLLLRFFKNKVDYCRLHGYDIFYNNVLFHPKMGTYWAKIPAVRAAMVAHPEAEWIWWVDSDAAFTDMEFKLPLERYREHDFVVHGWPELIYEKKSWLSLNAGVFLIRNSQWSMEFMDVWASMAPLSPDYDTWGKILKSTFKDKVFPESDDQSALVYLMLKNKVRWGDKIYVEKDYYFEGYWVEILRTLDNISESYVAVDRGVAELRRRHAEKVSEHYAVSREAYLEEAGIRWGNGKRPFITHFVGCQPCSGDRNKIYSQESCWDGMQRALGFADNQVLRNFGFVHSDVRYTSYVSPLPFDYPRSG